MSSDTETEDLTPEGAERPPRAPQSAIDTFRPDPPTAPLHRIEVPTPFAVGPANVYAVEDPEVGLTLIDTGPNSDAAWADLTAGLAALGYQVGDVQRILLTHGHVDHWGLAGRVVAASGAGLWAHRRLAPWLADPAAESARRLGWLTLFFRELGVPPGEVAAINRGIKWVMTFLAPVAAAGLWDDGDTVRLAGATWDVLYTPGHAPNHVCFHQPTLRALIAGDHLLGTITSNPILEAPLPGTTARPRSLPEYIGALERIAALPVLWVYPGHGAPFQGHRKLIKERLAFHDRRAAKVLDFLADGPASVYDLSCRLFPTLEGTERYLGLSETLGHLDLLEDRGQVRHTLAAGVLQYGSSE